jgi:hypothetical protein
MHENGRRLGTGKPVGQPGELGHSGLRRGTGRCGVDPRHTRAAKKPGRFTGPSIIDLPKPGCWHLTLQWGENSDTLNLVYLAP